MKQEVHAWRPDIRLLSIPSGIDLRIFRQMDRLDARRRLGHPNDEAPWVLFSTVQSNNPVKRENLARQAFELLRRQLPSARFQLLTGRPHSEVPLLVNASNVILLTSTHEGWPNIIKEGLACNVPFVSTNVSDLSRIAAVETSCRVVKDDASVLASSLLDVIQRPRPTGLRRFVEPMEMGKVARQLVGVYREVLGENIKSYGLKKS
jgi:glycosyltransferase involved in cell wall biosynthesis